MEPSVGAIILSEYVRFRTQRMKMTLVGVARTNAFEVIFRVRHRAPPGRSSEASACTPSVEWLMQREGGWTHFMHSHGVSRPLPSHPSYAGTERVGFSPAGQTSRAPTAKRREVLGQSREG